MKILFLLSLLTITLTARSQSGNYHPFPDSNAVWNWNFIQYYCTPFTPFDEDYSYTFDGDTLIGSMQYHKIKTPFIQVNNPGCGTHNDDGYKGCIRQDIANKKVYCILPNDSVEHIIFDFNLQVGDTIPTIPSFVCYSKLYVTQIDSVLIGNSYRKRWLSSSSAFNIIEGIGANWEFFQPMCEVIDGATGLLTCFTQNSTPVYPDSTFNCALITNINSVSDIHSFVKLFPNPFHTSMTISLNVENASMEIYNSFGEFVRHVKITEHSTVIHRNSLADGIYFYRLLTDNGKIASGKFVIKS
jgi:Secretion system C-terminal sorting domain